MTSVITSAALAIALLTAQKVTADNLLYAPFGESVGYSSEEGGGGSSYLGVDTRDITTDRLSALQLKEERGVEVTMVDQDAPAGKAGIKEHDVILSVNGMQIESVEQLRRVIHEIPPGRLVTLGLSRNGQPVSVKAQLADRKTNFMGLPSVKAFKFEVPPTPVVPDIDIPVSVVVVHSSARSGLMVENLTPQLEVFFGVKNGQGVLVRSVEKGSAAEKAGFHAGDVIVKVNNETISDTGDFSHTLRAGKENTVSIGIIRDKKEQTLSLTLPERKRSDVIEESFEVPDMDAETRVQMDAVRSQMALLKPELMKYAEEMKLLKPQMSEMTKELEKNKVQLQKEMEKFKQDWREHEKEYRQLIGQLFAGGADI
jgi:membrane-associated protease RseP (regulator of RpoE activity)